MTKKRSHGDGAIDSEGRGENTHRLRYRVDGKRFTKTFHGTLTEARNELRRLIQSGHTGEHVEPAKVTLATWIDRWIALNQRHDVEADGTSRRGLVNRRTLERYEELLRCHVTPTLGKRPLQKIQGTEIDDLYVALEKKLSPRTVHHVHTVLGACLKAAVRKGLITSNPVARAEAPSAGESDHGMALDEGQLRTLLEGFRPSPLFPIVAVLAFTGARRGEVLALRWTDLDVEKKTLRIERAVEQTSKFELAIKGPKTERGKRTITIDDDLIALLCSEREKLQRLQAGVPDGVEVDLSLVRLPDEALMFPNLTAARGDIALTNLRTPGNVTKEFLRRAALLGFPYLRLHDLRGTHETLLLDAGVPVHVVAARCGHDPAVLLRSYAKHSKKADTSAAAIIGAISKGVLRN
jgi:integrase